jgi:chromosome segregation ATPase
MSNDTTRSIRFEGELEQYLQEQDNASAVVRRALEAWKEGGGEPVSVMEIRAERLRDEIADLERRAEGKRERLEQLEGEIAEARDERRENERDALEEAMSHVRVRDMASAPEPQPADVAHWETVCDNYDVEFDDLLAAKRDEYDA